MRVFRALALTVLVSLLPLALGGDRAASFVQVLRPSVHALDFLLEAGIVCGTFDGKYSCKFVPGGAQHGKNAPPVPAATPEPAPDATGEQHTTHPAGGTWSTEATPGGAPDAAGSACQHGMIGTPPNCRCPESSELLGGNCVRYTASACSSGLASDALPQACRGVEEKLSCRMREDGLKDCCCVTYDKF
jgi:hypothetical protein